MSGSEKLLLKLVPVLLPLAVAWVDHHERKILRSGSPLSAEGLADAARMGVEFPEKVRMMEVERIPILNGWFVRVISRAFPTIPSHTAALLLGYGIYIPKFGNEFSRKGTQRSQK